MEICQQETDKVQNEAVSNKKKQIWKYAKKETDKVQDKTVILIS